MIITRTPFRMSFFGGGTDMPEFFNEHGGSVISTTFDKYCYVTARHLPRFFDYSTELVYSRIERVSDPSELEHPAVRNAMQMLDMREMRISYEADLPARSGLGTSSSFAVGMLNAFHCMKGTYASKDRLAREAIRLERELCAEAGGWQDQIAAAFGGLNRIDFAEGDFSVGAVVLTDKSADLSEFGRLLDTTWRLKRGTGSQISTGSIDALYERGMNAGALGGKLLGAGGGGFLVFYVEPDARESVRRAMSDLLYIPFEFEDGGTSVAYYGPEDYDLEGSR